MYALKGVRVQTYYNNFVKRKILIGRGPEQNLNKIKQKNLNEREYMCSQRGKKK
jgi:hypothetical protein